WIVIGLGIGTLVGGTYVTHEMLVHPSHAARNSATMPPNYDPSRSLAPLVESLQPVVVNIKVETELSQGLEQMSPLFEFFQPFLEQPSSPDGGSGGWPLQQGMGSGFVISEDGYILTNNHVVDGATTIRVTLQQGLELDATVVGADDRIDVALLKVDAGQRLEFAHLGSSTDARVGDWVVAIGHPLGLTHTVTAGIISAKGRAINLGPYDDFIQTDASINPGNSGGPLFNLDGEVIAINTAINRMGQGIAYSIPIDMVKDVIEDLKVDGRVARGWIGVGLQDVDESLAEALDIEQSGALVRQVYPGTPAEKAGLRSGDTVVTIDGEGIADSDAMVRAVGGHRPGQVIVLGVVRDGRDKNLRVTLGERPEESDLSRFGQRGGSSPLEQGSPQQSADRVSELGLNIVEADFLEGVMGEGVLIGSIDRESPAHGVLHAGDLVLEVNSIATHDRAQLNQALSEREDLALVLVQRQGSRVFVPVRLK
ncbi:MAG: trypsin-like peptidase domain-containing protein, partial [Myxococcota bacterium]|nr:trypsin-like peptidase domain-containing protein [Myxococcota bacterium]